MIAACSWLKGWIDEPDETGGLAGRLRKMTPEQRAEDARQLAERVRQRPIEAGKLPPDQVIDVEGERRAGSVPPVTR